MSLSEILNALNNNIDVTTSLNDLSFNNNDNVIATVGLFKKEQRWCSTTSSIFSAWVSHNSVELKVKNLNEAKQFINNNVNDLYNESTNVVSSVMIKEQRWCSTTSSNYTSWKLLYLNKDSRPSHNKTETNETETNETETNETETNETETNDVISLSSLINKEQNWLHDGENINAKLTLFENDCKLLILDSNYTYESKYNIDENIVSVKFDNVLHKIKYELDSNHNLQGTIIEPESHKGKVTLN